MYRDACEAPPEMVVRGALANYLEAKRSAEFYGRQLDVVKGRYLANVRQYVLGLPGLLSTTTRKNYREVFARLRFQGDPFTPNSYLDFHVEKDSVTLFTVARVEGGQLMHIHRHRGHSLTLLADPVGALAAFAERVSAVQAAVAREAESARELESAANRLAELSLRDELIAKYGMPGSEGL